MLPPTFQILLLDFQLPLADMELYVFKRPMVFQQLMKLLTSLLTSSQQEVLQLLWFSREPRNDPSPF